MRNLARLILSMCVALGLVLSPAHACHGAGALTVEAQVEAPCHGHDRAKTEQDQDDDSAQGEVCVCKACMTAIAAPSAPPAAPNLWAQPGARLGGAETLLRLAAALDPPVPKSRP